MSLIQIATLAIMAVFYITYFAKQISQRKQGINTMILGEGNKPKNQKRLEIMLKVATFIMPAVEIASIWRNLMELPLLVQWIIRSILFHCRYADNEGKLACWHT